MAVDATHPLYAEYIDRWNKMLDCYEGEEKIKEQGTVYLPATEGMIADGLGSDNIQSKGNLNYNAYRTRASFPDAVFDAVEVLLGIMHRKDPKIDLPQEMEGITTTQGETLPALLRRINEQQLKTGRLGLMADLATEDNGDLPYLALYKEKSIINWDAGSSGRVTPRALNLVVLKEQDQVRDGFDWKLENQYRVLQMGEFASNEQEGQYTVTVYDEGEQAVSTVTPSIRGNTLNEIPFVFCNSKDLVPDPDRPPLLGLANLALTIYRGDADHRQALFMQAQDTLTVIGGDAEDTYRTGAGATICPPIGGDAKFIGVSSDGLTEMRKEKENDKKIASHKAAQMTDTTSRQKESGDALKTRVGAQTATLNQVALAGAQALEDILKIVARWIGADPNKVSVKPNMDFAEDELIGKTLVEYMTAKIQGAPISLKTIHRLMGRKGITEMSYEDELVEIEGEEPLVTGTEAGGDEEDMTDDNPPQDDEPEDDGDDEDTE